MPVSAPTTPSGSRWAPATPTALLHALGARSDWTDLRVSGALLTDLYEVFTKPNVTFLSGFFGPAEQFLRDCGGRVEFVPADFRRFAPLLAQLAPGCWPRRAPRPMPTAGCRVAPRRGDGRRAARRRRGP